MNQSYLMTLEGETLRFDLNSILDKVSSSVGKIGSIGSQVSDIFNSGKSSNQIQLMPQKELFDFKPYILPATALGMVLLIKALKK